MSETRTIKVEALTRVEGEGGLHVRLNGNTVEEVQLSIYEPPRFFEGFLRGRPLEEVPDITARICGICPVAYQMSAVHALEQALGVSISPEIRRLRRLLYCGEWIESHGLHMHLLQALAGRAIHPINVAVGGFYRAPKKEELRKLIPAFEWGLQAAIDATRWVAGFDFPDFDRNYEMISVCHPDEYPMNQGRIVPTSGLSIDVSEYEQMFAEYHVAHSTALHSHRTSDHSSYHVGPLARVNLNREKLCENARRVADDIGFTTPCFNPFKAIIARSLEVIHAFDEALTILREYKPFKPSRIPYQHRAGEGWAATEAPRGLIYHRYQVDDQGKVELAKIVPPTSQNQRQIELDLIDWLPRVLCDDDQHTADECERLIRSYDPCISCSTHFLKLTFDRRESRDGGP